MKLRATEAPMDTAAALFEVLTDTERETATTVASIDA